MDVVVEAAPVTGAVAATDVDASDEPAESVLLAEHPDNATVSHVVAAIDAVGRRTGATCEPYCRAQARNPRLLIPGNPLLDDDGLAAIIDWGGCGQGDTARDLAPAWAVLTAPGRTASGPP